MAQQVADEVWRVPGARNNFYIVGDGDSITLIDSGYPGDWKRLTAAFDSLDRSMSDLSAVLITHGHPDHIGCAERMRTEHDATIHSHVIEKPLVMRQREQQISIGYMLGRLWSPKMFTFVVNALRNQGASPPPVEHVVTFDGGTPLDVPGHPSPIFTPGHTDGHCSFHLPDRGVLFTGDALVTEDVVTQERGPRLLGEAFNHDQAQTVRSLGALLEVDADVVLPGHGDPHWGSPAHAIERAMSRL